MVAYMLSDKQIGGNMQPKHPVWVYEPPAGSDFPFIGAVRMPDGSLETKHFATRQEAVYFTEEVVGQIMIPGGERR